MQKKPDLDTELGYARLMLAILEDDHEVNERGIQFYKDRIEEIKKKIEEGKRAKQTTETV